jgi:hypothetical protein
MIVAKAEGNNLRLAEQYARIMSCSKWESTFIPAAQDTCPFGSIPTNLKFNMVRLCGKVEEQASNRLV